MTINKLEYKFTIYYYISLLSLLLLFLSLYHFYYYHHFSLTEFIPSSIISMTPYGNNGLYLGKTITGAKAATPAKGTFVSTGLNEGSANQNVRLSV